MRFKRIIVGADRFNELPTNIKQLNGISFVFVVKNKHLMAAFLFPPFNKFRHFNGTKIY